MNKFKTYTDKCLLALLKKEDLGAFEEIYNRYWSQLYSAAFKRVQSRETAEELVQDIFTSLWENRKSAAVENLPAYLFTATKYKIIKNYHREISKRAYFQAQSGGEAIDNSTEETVLLGDLTKALEREIDKLPAKRQMIYKLYRQENLSMREVASRLGISEKTVENQLTKAVKMLRVSLKHFLILCITAILEGLI